ncbi:MAG: NUDIX domain-containing protein [Minisyncoccia bacterium]
MRLPVVDKNDEIIGYKNSDELAADDIIRVSGVWILNSKGEVLVAQRAASKKYDPLKWAVSAAGTVDEGETYAQNIVKEVQEELAVAIHESDLILGEHLFVETNHLYFYQAYFLRRDIAIENFKLEEEEVESVRWISVPELARWFAEKPDDFIPSFYISMKHIEDFCATSATIPT